MGASVLARIKKQSKETGLNYQSCLQLFAQEEFHDVLMQIDRFVGPVFEAIVNEDEFFGTWVGSQNEWC